MRYEKPYVYAVKHRNHETRMKSRSGGIFTALSDEVLKRNGIIYGCVLDENNDAVHIRAKTNEVRNLMRGSKYLQSKLKDTFNSVKKDLENNDTVLFTGTSCQIAGLKAFLKKEYSKLYCVDIVCHGVPSDFVWQEYIKWQEKKHGKCIKVDFRNKRKYGWRAHIETLSFKKNNKIIEVDSNVYASLFAQKNIIRPSCYKCPYKDIIHPSNITIADYWGIAQACPSFNDNEGISLVLVNDEKGKELFDLVSQDIDYRESDTDNCLQPSLIKPFDMPKNRNKFWTDFNKYPFNIIVYKYVYSKIRKQIKYITLKLKNR